jgi:hypothetical protein
MGSGVMKGSRFRCAHCGRVFVRGVSQAEAVAEAQELWGVKNAAADSRMVEVCDGCFKLMDPKKFPALAQEARDHLKRG